MKINRLFTMATTILLLLSLGTGIVLAQEEEPPPEPKNPVALFLAGLLGTDYSYKGIVDDQIAGIGLGVIGRAYSLSQITGVGVADILKDSQMYDWGQLQKAYLIAKKMDQNLETTFEQASEIGWGQLFKEAGLHPGSGGHGLGWLFKEYGAKGRPGHTGPPEWAGLKPGSHASDQTGPPGHAGKNNKNKDKWSDE